jgi:ureidoacrylate peracid hydrolase
MHKVVIRPAIIERVKARMGREHAFESLSPEKTALIVIDMQYFFLQPGYLGEVPMAREIVPCINRLAAGVRRLGGLVVWVRNIANDTRESWSNYHEFLFSREKIERRFITMDESHEGSQLWPELDVQPEDAHAFKRRFSAFVQGSSDLEAQLRARGIDTVLIAGTSTNICCESSARDAMMLNFKTIMVSDALATFSDEEHNASLSAFYAIFGDVQDADSCLALLTRGAHSSVKE